MHPSIAPFPHSVTFAAMKEVHSREHTIDPILNQYNQGSSPAADINFKTSFRKVHRQLIKTAKNHLKNPKALEIVVRCHLLGKFQFLSHISRRGWENSSQPHCPHRWRFSSTLQLSASSLAPLSTSGPVTYRGKYSKRLGLRAELEVWVREIYLRTLKA